MPTTPTVQSRVRLGELAAGLDDQLTLALALHYGRDLDHVLSLIQDVMWRVPVEERIRLLDAALWRTGLHDKVPFLAPSLGEVFRVRNLLAHTVTFEESDEALELFSVRSGKRKMVTLAVAKLRWATGAASLCRYNYFPQVESRIGRIETWGQLYRLDER